MMKLPEYFLSTPRLVLVLLTLAMIGLTISGIVEPDPFVNAVMLVFGYFFGSRGQEKSKEEKFDPNNHLESNIN